MNKIDEASIERVSNIIKDCRQLNLTDDLRDFHKKINQLCSEKEETLRQEEVRRGIRFSI